jgi:hypothetical protein
MDRPKPQITNGEMISMNSNPILFTDEEVESLKSIVLTHNGVLKASGDWPEKKLHEGILDKIIDISYKIYLLKEHLEE